jgi:hypothetical protein
MATQNINTKRGAWGFAVSVKGYWAVRPNSSQAAAQKPVIEDCDAATLCVRFCRASITSLIELGAFPPRHALDELARIERELRRVHTRVPCSLGFRARVLDNRAG